MTQAVDPAGPWSPLHCVQEARGWIAPCPFWDDDGQADPVHGVAKNRIGYKSVRVGASPSRFGVPTRDRWVVEALHEPAVVFSVQCSVFRVQNRCPT